jgi:hypothetical protein
MSFFSYQPIKTVRGFCSVAVYQWQPAECGYLFLFLAWQAVYLTVFEVLLNIGPIDAINY